jgi:hypothetical protein
MAEFVVPHVPGTEATESVTGIDEPIKTDSSICGSAARIVVTKATEIDVACEFFVALEFNPITEPFITKIMHLHLALAAGWLKLRISHGRGGIAVQPNGVWRQFNSQDSLGDRQCHHDEK